MELLIFIQLIRLLYIYLEDFIFNGIFNLEESRIKRNKKMQIKEVNEDADNNKLVDSKRSAINIKIKFFIFEKQ